MEIEVHGLYVVIHNISMDGIRSLCNDVLGFKFESMVRKGRTSKRSEWYKSFGAAKESVFIKKYGQDGSGYTALNLHGSFFDNFDCFKLTHLFYFLSEYNHTFEQLDVAYNDYGTCLYDEELEHWFKNYNEYIAGSFAAKSRPMRLLAGIDIEAYRFNLPKSKNMFATIYKRPDTELWRVEIKVKSKEKILYLLEAYDDEDRENFDQRCANLLSTCIRFVKPHSKRSGKSTRQKMQPAWEAFMYVETEKLVWSKELKERRNNRIVADKL